MIESVKSHLYNCTSCGKCSIACPMSDIMKNSPKRIIELILEDSYDIDDISVFMCNQCKMCEKLCDEKIKISTCFELTKEYLRSQPNFKENNFTINDELEKNWTENGFRDNFIYRKIMTDSLTGNFLKNFKKYLLAFFIKKDKMIPQHYEDSSI